MTTGSRSVPHGRGNHHGRPNLRHDSLHGNGAHDQLGHRSDHVSDSAGAGTTGRDKIVKFEGNYHGHWTLLVVRAPVLTHGEPVLRRAASLAEHTITLSYNDPEGVEACFAEIGEQIACIIVEPVAGNMNCIPPQPGFLETLRHVCNEYGSILIFDEVMTGFRVALGGAQAYYGVTPDLTCLGKIVGGGMPVGAFGGKRDIMQNITAGPGVPRASGNLGYGRRGTSHQVAGAGLPRCPESARANACNGLHVPMRRGYR